MKTFFKRSGPAICSEEWLEREKADTRKKVDHYNGTEGHLNEIDGIDCPVCKNKGHVAIADESGIDYHLQRCKCQDRREITARAKHSGLGRLLYAKIADFKVEGSWQQEMKSKAVQYMKDPSGWFVVLGQPGAGKTLICGIVSAQLLRTGKRVEFKSWPELVRESNVEWFKEKEVLQRFKEVEVLYIDDFLKTGTDARSLQIAYEILNYRYNYQKPTIISGERSLSEMWQLDEAIASRMKEMAGDSLIDVGHGNGRNQRAKK